MASPIANREPVSNTSPRGAALRAPAGTLQERRRQPKHSSRVRHRSPRSARVECPLAAAPCRDQPWRAHQVRERCQHRPHVLVVRHREHDHIRRRQSRLPADSRDGSVTSRVVGAVPHSRGSEASARSGRASAPRGSLRITAPRDRNAARGQHIERRERGRGIVRRHARLPESSSSDPQASRFSRGHGRAARTIGARQAAARSVGLRARAPSLRSRSDARIRGAAHHRHAGFTIPAFSRAILAIWSIRGSPRGRARCW